MFGIRVPLAVDDYIWVNNPNTNDPVFNPEPLLFETREEALDHAKIWGPFATVKEYKQEEYA